MGTLKSPSEGCIHVVIEIPPRVVNAKSGVRDMVPGTASARAQSPIRVNDMLSSSQGDVMPGSFGPADGGKDGKPGHPRITPESPA